MPESLPILYSFRRCPYAMRARLALAVSGLSCELREVELKNKPLALLQASPKGTVPVLVLPDGSVIDESLDIMGWALRQQDPFGWLPVEHSALTDALTLVSQCDGDFKPHLDQYKYPHRFGLPNGLAAREAGSAFLRTLEARLGMQAHLVTADFGLSDAAIAPFVRQFAHTDPLWFATQTWPRLQNWLVTFETSELFDRVMQKYPLWLEGNPAIWFPG
jgi:glutathione S-transferase